MQISFRSRGECNDRTVCACWQDQLAVHYYGKKRAGRKVPSLTDEQMKSTPPLPRPVVRTHDEPKALYVDETMTD